MNGPAIVRAVEMVTKRWCWQRKAEERKASSVARRLDAMIRSRRIEVKQAAWEIMRKAYLKASENGPYPRVASARQIMYAARDYIQERSQRMLDDQYFTQTLLPDYMTQHQEETADWDVVFDARGHFTEPHTEIIVPLGTIDVREYLQGVKDHSIPNLKAKLLDNLTDLLFPTRGPKHRFQAILFIEKEGFMPHFKAVRLAARYDIAIMSTKGISVTASRRLVDTLCGQHRVPLLVLRDFDKAGFTTAATFQGNTRRYSFQNKIEVVDIGLRLEDVQGNRLKPERESYGKSDPRPNLRKNGATEEEIQFLFDPNSKWPAYAGWRVELNEFTTGALIAWIESKLQKHGIKKVVPDECTLEAAFRRAAEALLLRECIERIAEDVHAQAQRFVVPLGLAEDVTARLREDPSLAWDQVVGEYARRIVKTTAGQAS